MSRLGLFVRAREEEKSWMDGGMEKVEMKPSAARSGEEVREFYQSLFQQEDGGGDGERKEGNKERRERRRARRGQVRGGGGAGAAGASGSPGSAAPPAGPTEGYRLLRCAEQGDVSGVETLLQRGCDINFRDEFKWTPLMSACYSGRTRTARVLLHRGASWRGVTDQQGRDARDLARLAGHQEIVAQLEHCDIKHPSRPSHTPADTPHHSPAAPSQWCEVCKVSYSGATPTHHSSTLHQFCLKRPPSTPHYCLAPSSASYRMMLRLGWDPRSGLGPGHAGRLDPVGTVLRSDKSGLGFGDRPRSKVTHFGAKDVQAVKRAPKRRGDRTEREATVSTKQRRRKEEQEKQWERDYRSSFNFDF
ncbi:G patch domain and ankyrin repeat-containing protein 1 [Trichomycterus rosablanca]|uniref:G patch domain and ankyrin repeat-containing protein 1 n=1 Tax=Trichomycterus rosablanca TaxID=2290929 RepID=UPI002F351B9D